MYVMIGIITKEIKSHPYIFLQDKAKPIFRNIDPFNWIFFYFSSYKSLKYNFVCALYSSL